MNKNCLLTKFKGVASNDSLLELGEIDINVNTTEITDASVQQSILLYVNDNININVGNAGGFANTLEELQNNPQVSGTLSKSREVFFKNGDYKIKIVPKYNLIGLKSQTVNTTIFSFNPNMLEYSKGLTFLDLRGIRVTDTVDISFFKNFDLLQELCINGHNVIGSISSLAQKSSFERCIIYNCSVDGDISSLGKNIHLILCRFDNTNISGSIESLAESMITNGRTSGYMNVICNGFITYNGEVVPNGTEKTISFSGSTYTVQ